MTKSRILILASILLATICANGQEWIGHRFTLDTIVRMQCTKEPENLNLVKCDIQDNTFYFVEQQSFQQKENDFHAVIHALRLDNYEQTEILLPLPQGARNKEHYARSLWIYDFCFDGDYLLVTTQEELILYKRIQDQNYEVVSNYRHQNLFMGYLHQNKIHFFEEDHDKGFKWFQKELGSDSATLVRELPYEAPHIVQIQPNRYLSHNKNNVLFLSTRYPRLEIYSLDGQLLETHSFNLPSWKPFEDNYIQKTLSFPYGIERIYAVKDDIYDYSYPKVVMPLRGDFLLLYAHYDTLIGKSVLQYAVKEDNGQTLRYLRSNHEDSVYTAAQFPFTLFQGGFDKGNAAGNGKIVQLTYQTDVSWNGRTNQEYLAELDKYYSDRSPSLAYQIMDYRPRELWKRPLLYPTASEQPVSLDELSSSQSVLILHQGLECSGCVKAIYQILDQSIPDSIHIGHVYPHPLKGLAVQERRNQIRHSLDKPFSFYANLSPNFSDLTAGESLTESDFPCLLLCRHGHPPILLKVSEIFANDSSTAFSESFLKRWQSFISASSSLTD